MTQLDFKAFSPYCSEDVARRHDAFWGGLCESRRTAVRVACDAFSFAAEANWQLGQVKRNAGDPAKRDAAYHLLLECAAIAIAKFRHFGSLAGCRDDAETVERLDKLIEYAERRKWRIVPDWWIENTAGKDTAYFIRQIKIYAGKRDAWIVETAKAKREAADAKRRAAQAKREAAEAERQAGEAGQ